ncbi:hypothetical protein X765_22025 [Mesorhizobium sp. LSHC440B00]|nr:hypothetical protein X765_22025 [Mesorhizobium sp. LSHC440B00]ESX35509.1 hypothetical protein X763_17365 [Mesorhizobium sp. LSHC432A00]
MFRVVAFEKVAALSEAKDATKTIRQFIDCRSPPSQTPTILLKLRLGQREEMLVIVA